MVINPCFLSANLLCSIHLSLFSLFLCLFFFVTDLSFDGFNVFCISLFQCRSLVLVLSMDFYIPFVFCSVCFLLFFRLISSFPFLPYFLFISFCVLTPCCTCFFRVFYSLLVGFHPCVFDASGSCSHLSWRGAC